MSSKQCCETVMIYCGYSPVLTWEKFRFRFRTRIQTIISSFKKLLFQCFSQQVGFSFLIFTFVNTIYIGSESKFPELDSKLERIPFSGSAKAKSFGSYGSVSVPQRCFHGTGKLSRVNGQLFGTSFFEGRGTLNSQHRFNTEVRICNDYS
jgi:hypothetical protein